MTTAKVVDLKGLASEERERRLFGALDGLRTGAGLQVCLEFNPLALAYALKAGGEFRVEYLKEGPAEWILELTRMAQPPEKREQLKELLRQTQKGTLSPEGREQARQLLGVLDVATLALLERELAREGLSQAEIRRLLSRLNEQVLRDSLEALGREADSRHPVRTLLGEHRVILAALDALEEAVQQLEASPSPEAARDPLERLRRAAVRLERAESHHRREEEVIFPRLERLGLVEPPALMRQDHERFRRRQERLAALAGQGPEQAGFGLWRCELVDHGQFLVRELASHILKEDNVLYHEALRTFDAAEWERVREESDAIGYCRFDPEPESPAVELDMRTVPLLQRQARILSAWSELPVGALLRLISDRQPKPLYHLFEATQRGRFEWRYEKEGPEEWIAVLRKR